MCGTNTHHPFSQIQVKEPAVSQGQHAMISSPGEPSLRVLSSTFLAAGLPNLETSWELVLRKWNLKSFTIISQAKIYLFCGWVPWFQLRLTQQARAPFQEASDSSKSSEAREEVTFLTTSCVLDTKHQGLITEWSLWSRLSVSTHQL
jgi:hypothetical protein